MPDSPGDQEFEGYFVAHARGLRRLAYGMCGDWHLAEDIVSATFVRLYQRWSRVRLDTADAYARKILTNVFLSDYPKRRREQVTASLPDKLAPAVGSEDRLDIAVALRDLTPRQRAMVVLRYVADMSIAEVAETLGVAEGTVKSQTARGLQALRSAMDVREGVPGDA